VSDTGEVIFSDPCTVKPTKLTNDYYEITLEDGAILTCTPEHRLMLADGSYKMVKDLTLSDELIDFQKTDIKIFPEDVYT